MAHLHSGGRNLSYLRCICVVSAVSMLSLRPSHFILASKDAARVSRRTVRSELIQAGLLKCS